MLNKKILISAIIILILLVIGAGGYFVYQKYFSPTAGWKTYANNEYGFEIKYPTDLKFSGELGNNTNPLFAFSKSNSYSIMLSIDFTQFAAGYNLIDYVNQYNKTVNACSSGDCPQAKIINTKKILVDGYDAIQQQVAGDYPRILQTFFKKGKGPLWSFWMSDGESKTNFTKEEIDTYNKILSTLKFTK